MFIEDLVKKWDPLLPIGFDQNQTLQVLKYFLDHPTPNPLIPLDNLSVQQQVILIKAYIEKVGWEDTYVNNDLVTYGEALQAINTNVGSGLGKILFESYIGVYKVLYDYLNKYSSSDKRPLNAPKEISGGIDQKAKENLDIQNTFNITIQNFLDDADTVSIYTENDQGDRVKLQDLPNGASYNYVAFLGQYFEAVLQNNMVVGRYFSYPGHDFWKIEGIKDILEPSIKEKLSGTLRIQNNSSTYLEIYWIDVDCEPINMTALRPGASTSFEAYSGDHWIAAQGNKRIAEFYVDSQDLTWTIDQVHTPVNGAYIHKTTYASFLEASPIDSYTVGTNDFTIMAMAQVKLLTYDSPPIVRLESSNQSGAVIGFTEGGANITFEIFRIINGNLETFAVSAPATIVTDGGCHHICGVKSSGTLSLYIDGKLAATPISYTPKDFINIVNPKVRIGYDGIHKLDGLVMNIGFFSKALTTQEIALANFMKLDTLQDSLLAYWPLNNSLVDQSKYQNNMQSYGNVEFVPCFSCVYLYGDNNYVFCQMGNPQNDMVSVTNVERYHTVTIPPQTEYLYAGIFEDANLMYQFPPGITLAIEDPSGKKYNQPTNTESLYVKMSGNSIYVLCVKQPVEGDWKITITGKTNTSFMFQLQTAPLADNAETMTNTLSQFFHNFQDTAVTAISGLIAVTNLEAEKSDEKDIDNPILLRTEIGQGVLLLAAAAAAVLLISIGLIIYSEKQQPQPKQINRNRNKGFLFNRTANIQLLLADAAYDNATIPGYEWRKDNLYPLAESFPHTVELVKEEFTKDNFQQSLNLTNLRYVSVNSHGDVDSLEGFGQKTVLGDADSLKLVSNKIFHLAACLCGKENGLGQSMTEKTLKPAPAKAFVGYKDLLVNNSIFPSPVAECDGQIDLILLRGGTVLEAYNSARRMYKQKSIIPEIFKYFSILLTNKDRLVMYGDPNATIK